MKPFEIQAISTDEVEDEMLDGYGIRLLVKRLDKTPSLPSGNKYFKLKYNLEEAKRKGFNTLLTFGGAYSNHILATAAAGKESGFRTIGIIRGEEKRDLNPLLKKAKELGMEFFQVDRTIYREKNKPDFLIELKKNFGNFYLLPEGGSNKLAVEGCKEILDKAGIQADSVFCCCGTGATLSGIILSLKEGQRAVGISVLKGGAFLENNVQGFLDEFSHKTTGNWCIKTNYSHGGYARSNEDLRMFMQRFKFKTGIPVEFVYTGKMFFAIYDLAKKGYFRKGETVMAIHTGGVFIP